MDNKLLYRYLSGDCSDEDRIEVAKWIDESPDHLEEYLSLRKINDISIWRLEDYELKQRNSKGSFTILKEVLKIAAVVAISLLVYRIAFNREITGDIVAVADNYSGMQILNVPAGQRAEITLEDGTNIWLNAGSILKFPGRFDGDIREVELDGEGYFEVTSDSDSPFIVKTKNYDIKVTGTAFNLLAYSRSNKFETTLVEGSVEILDSEGDEEIRLKANELAYLNDGEIMVTPVDDLSHLLWKDGIICIEDETFGDLLHKLELYYDVSIVVLDKGILDRRYSGKFRTKDGLNHVLKVFKLYHNFDFSFDKENNIVTIE